MSDPRPWDLVLEWRKAADGKPTAMPSRMLVLSGRRAGKLHAMTEDMQTEVLRACADQLESALRGMAGEFEESHNECMAAAERERHHSHDQGVMLGHAIAYRNCARDLLAPSGEGGSDG